MTVGAGSQIAVVSALTERRYRYRASGRAAEFGDETAVREDKISFHHILELPYIAGPVVPDTCFK